MDRTVSIGTYSPAGLRISWVEGFEINVAVHHDEVTIFANPEGLKSLAQHLLTLAEDGVPNGVHLHFEPGNELEDNSASLILNRGMN